MAAVFSRVRRRQKPSAARIGQRNPLARDLEIWWGGERDLTRTVLGPGASISSGVRRGAKGGVIGAEVTATGNQVTIAKSKPASTQPFTVAFRVLTGSAASNRALWSWATTNATSQTPFMLVNSNGTNYRVYLNGDYRHTLSAASGSLLSLAITWDGSQWEIFESGNFVRSYGGAYGGFSGVNIYVGSGFSAASEDSVYDYFGHWHRALSKAEIHLLHRDPYGIYEPKRVVVSAAAAPPAGGGAFGYRPLTLLGLGA